MGGDSYAYISQEADIIEIFGVSFNLALTFSWFFLHSSVSFISIWRPVLQGKHTEVSSAPQGGMETNITEFRGMSKSTETQTSSRSWETRKLFF